MSGKDLVFPVGFDEAAMAEDLDRLSESAGEALTALRAEVAPTVYQWADGRNKG